MAKWEYLRWYIDAGKHSIVVRQGESQRLAEYLKSVLPSAEAKVDINGWIQLKSVTRQDGFDALGQLGWEMFALGYAISDGDYMFKRPREG